MSGKLVRLVLLAALSLPAVACVHVKPWERGKLAHHTMVEDLSGPAEEHVHAVHEGAVGGSTGAGGGCGCN
jgi:hypothetical protein